ncbi:cytochrome c [Pseudomonas sp. S75]|uniref:c-type cytochrome n=1 Tax=unclassified Pseudomonas TaxID=196821 RepID=UPI00190360E7|nr:MULTISPECIES: cytochrome c [unclassified Pseudomonas]MBJ9974889.1 cytochrome c [Pseudomonas sp. S30]MBK0152357.1 cytochrome c [Pseudomonas sp. S75]
MCKRLTAVLLATLALCACERVDPNSPLAQRKAIFKDMLRTSEDLGGMLRGRLPFQASGFKDGAARLDALAHQPWAHFPKVRDGGDSSARPEVWARQAQFEALARDLERATGELVQVTAASPLDKGALKPPMDRVEAACQACHAQFRTH